VGKKRDTLLAAALTELSESFADVQAQLAADAKGWGGLGDGTHEFSHELRRLKAEDAELAIALNPLIKRGVNLRTAYIWGQGVTVTIRDEASTGQDIQAVLTQFWDDPMNGPLCTLDGQIDRERELAGPGEVWLALPTTERGRVRVRPLPAGEVTHIVTDPEDKYTDWFYLREYTVARKPHKVLFPALGYRPAIRPDVMDHDAAVYVDRPDLTGVEIRWDSPVLKFMVNKLGKRGLGDVFASVPWAVAYKGFLEAWHRIMISLAKYVWQAKTKPDKAQKVAQEILANAARQKPGDTLISDPGTGIEAISKSGATFDADSGKPLAGMIAAGLGVPVTMLLTDPGISGARAVAETLDEPTQLEFGVRRKLWSAVMQEVVGWVIDSAVRGGTLRGTVERDGDREVVTLPEADNRTVVVDWPPFDSTPMETLVKAITEAQQTETIPPLVILRLLLKALEVEDADEILTAATDEAGNFIPLDVADTAARTKQEDRGNQ
jgi:hypothetical protein